MTSTCPICGAAALERHEGEYRMEPPPNIPGGTLVVPSSTWEECGACHEQVLPPALTDALDGIRYDRLGLLRPEEIRAVRERAGLSQVEMAIFVGTGEKTYSRWESGRSLQNRSSDNLIRLADRFPALFAQLEAQRDPDRQQKIEDYLDGLCGMKGDSALAMAAHGAEIDATLAETLRERLRLLAAQRK
jgi:putative zinc finger/helix-turn-helix YgiT family protein